MHSTTLSLALALLSPLTALSGLKISDAPVCTIEGSTSCLQRPEGIAFSPTGDLLAIANSDSDSITLYNRIADDVAIYETTPFAVLTDGTRRDYLHDVDFTPCGQFVAAANRNSLSVIFFKREGNTFKSTPHRILEGKNTKLSRPAGLSFSPSGKLLGVANRWGSDSLTFYKQTSHGTYNPNPSKIVKANLLRKFDLSEPHALVFAPDKKTFATIHKRFRKTSLGKSALVIWDTAQMYPEFILPLGYEFYHSISFHPSGEYLAITKEKENVVIFKKSQKNTFELCTEIPVDGEGRKETCKGVAFSACGNYIGFTSTKPAIFIYEILEQ